MRFFNECKSFKGPRKREGDRDNINEGIKNVNRNAFLQ